jgi:hypothetical protein
VAAVMVGQVVAAGQGPGDDEPDPPLLEHVRDPLALARLETAVGGLGEPECPREEEGGLGGVADVELEVVDPVNRHPVRIRDPLRMR